MGMSTSMKTATSFDFSEVRILELRTREKPKLEPGAGLGPVWILYPHDL
jgi:hypothetical protein